VIVVNADPRATRVIAGMLDQEATTVNEARRVIVVMLVPQVRKERQEFC
jgi:hypothetical protein